MKILFIAPSAYLLGGVQDWLFLLVMGLRNKGHGVSVAIPNNSHHKGTHYNEYYDGLQAIFFSNKTGTPEGRIRSLSKLLLMQRADITVGVNIGDLYEAYRRVYTKLDRTRLVMTVHAIEGDYLGDIGRYHSLLDAVVTTNKLTQKIVTKLGLIESENIFYAPYGVKIQSRDVERKNDGCLRIAWVGRLDNQQKRICDLKGILQSLDMRGINYHLSVAGNGPCLEDILKELESWIIIKRVSFKGFLDKSRLASFYEEHDVLLITSKWETGPIVAWEAMVAGLAIVSSRYIGSSSEEALINEETALLYPIGSHDEAANQLVRLSDQDFRDRLIQRGQRMAISRYSSEASVQIWEDTFLKLSLKEKTRQLRLVKEQPVTAPGRLGTLMGKGFGEFLRLCLGKKGSFPDPGSEWPHSLYGYSNQEALLNYAELLEKGL